MAGEIRKTEGVVLAIRPWSRTSHMVRWLTPDCGCVTTSVKGAVRPKSAFLGQYDLYYTNELLYYARAQGEAHALRETTPILMRERLRGRWRETYLAGYAAALFADHAPASSEAAVWYAFFNQFLDGLAAPERPANLMDALIMLECAFLSLTGLAPELPNDDPPEGWVPFSIEGGRMGVSGRVVRLTTPVVALLRELFAHDISLGRAASPLAAATRETKISALRFLGTFLVFHADVAPELRRGVHDVIVV